MTARITSPEITEPQKKQIARLVEDTMAALDLTKDSAQRILENGGVFKEWITPILKNLGSEKSPSLTYAAKHIQRGWEIVEGEDVFPTLTSMADLEPVKFLVGLEEDEDVLGVTMRKRGIEKRAMLGLSDAAWLLDHQSEIPPVELRKYHLVFAGTTLRDPSGYHYVAYLFWADDQWYLDFYSLCNFVSCSFRLARRKPVGT
jgi:hypothetical protein